MRVLTATREYLVRTPLKELSAQLDPQVFWQVHRGTLVRASAIRSVARDSSGKLSIALQGALKNWPSAVSTPICSKAM